jgi:uncharacterized protein
MKTERKDFQFAQASIDDSGVLEGRVAAYGNVDSYGDVIAPNSIKNLDEFLRLGSLMVGHSWGGFGIGTIEEAQETEDGLWIKAVYHSDPEAQAARTRAKERLERGKYVGLSIGYSATDVEAGRLDGRDVRYIKGYDLYEASQVFWPANVEAYATSAKNISLEDQFEAALAAVAGTKDRVAALKALREAEGRSLSDTNNARIEALAAEVFEAHQSLKSLVEQPEEGAPDDEIQTAIKRYLRMQLAA